MSVASDATRAQIRAATPSKSSWVSANAGSGKTRVLTDRVARLLLRGTDPEKVLCLTYTKAAAAEMQNRLFARLGAWAMMPDADLRAALRDLGEDEMSIEAAQLARARTLFARALETPGGLKIQTIHAFCERLLRRFPLESGVSPQFEVMEDRQARLLRAEILEMLAEQHPESFDPMAHYLSGDDPDDLLRDILANRARFSIPTDAQALSKVLEVPADTTDATLLRLARAGVSETALRDLASVLVQGGGSHDAKTATGLLHSLEAATPAQALIPLEAVFLTSGRPRKTGTFPVAAARKIDPGAAPLIETLIDNTYQARQARLAREACDKALALNSFARAFLGEYAVQKAALGRLDFDDLIARAAALLTTGDTAQWVLYRLDGGIDHILVDEAQDTAPAQWQVIEALSAEFFAGEAARNVSRTIFVVGDEKQSIYSFQGADPAAFGAMQAHFRHALDDVAEGLELCELLYSFRSARPILDLVDEVYRGAAGADLSSGISHVAFHGEKPGRVDLWPFVEKDPREDDGPWYLPVDQPLPADPSVVLARQLAARIRAMLDTRQVLPGSSDNRAIAPGDILVLVRRRSTLFHAIIRELKSAGVPVAGADRLLIGGELAVKDLLALLRFLLTPGDDLSLAAVLRSPLGGLDEADLYRLAQGRSGTLWDRVQRHAPEALVSRLNELREQADFLRPFEILERILVRQGGRAALIARLGYEAEDGIDALLAQAMAYEQIEAPSLTGFLNWIDAGAVEVKRQLDQAGDQVRVMTVHAAKGLEAPVVILPDTAKRRDPRAPEVARLADGLAAWRVKKDDMPAALAMAEETRLQLARAESWRLLYVALTRAESWLIIAGAGEQGGGCWYDEVAAAMVAQCAIETPEGQSLLHLWSETPGETRQPGGPAPELPDWARQSGPRVPVSHPPLSPSDLGGAHTLSGESDDGPAGEAEAKLRGHRLHLLLEHLPGLPASERKQRARDLLRGGETPATEEEAQQLLSEAEIVLNAPHLADVFAENALIEVAVTADVPGLGRIRGQIDRLIITPDSILAIDFKSNRIVPQSVADVPEALLRQMGAYRAALAMIWPDRVVDVALLWTRDTNLQHLPHEAVTAALTRRGQA